MTLFNLKCQIGVALRLELLTLWPNLGCAVVRAAVYRDVL
uniref:Uncharacterized protein n=1 Tax=Rheinheimera sp. BAL341 TaxID=1708203 RepID=A0A486XS03_9GAMM